jgi:hypothetical protein
MNRLTGTLVAVLCTIAAWTLANAQTTETSVVKVPQDIVYKGLPGAPQHVTLFGDSSQPGLYVDRIKFLPGMKVMPHWHPDKAHPETALLVEDVGHVQTAGRGDACKGEDHHANQGTIPQPGRK